VKQRTTIKKESNFIKKAKKNERDEKKKNWPLLLNLNPNLDHATPPPRPSPPLFLLATYNQKVILKITCAKIRFF
jgi:hypothetical protein